MEQRKKFIHVSSRPVPYTTKTGIQIGRFYEPPRQKLTPEGEYVQGILLGARSTVFPERHKIALGAYMVAYIALITLIALVVAR